MTKWEYFLATYSKGMLGWNWKEKDFLGFDEMGAEGWELVVAVPTTDDGTTVAIEYVFKRPLS